MARFGFCGPSYSSESLNADAQMTMNWYPEAIEGGGGRASLALYPTPGLRTFCTLPTQPVRGLFQQNGRMFAVSGSELYEIKSNGSFTSLGNVGNDGRPASICAGITSLCIGSNGHVWTYNLNDGTFAQQTTGLGPISLVGYSDGFFIALLANNQKFQISEINDPTTWDPTQVTQVSLFPDNITSMIIDHREIWLLGRTKSTVYYNSGAGIFPFVPDTSAYIEQGAVSTFGRDRIDNSIMWWGADDRGQGMAWRANGYSPVRISNHAVELAIQSYPRIDDVVTYSYQDRGHTFWVSHFASANATWVYDAANQMWHQRGHWDGSKFNANKAHTHVMCFGKHLVGDWTSGVVWEMSIPVQSGSSWLFCTDGSDDDLIRRVRRTPAISIQKERLFHSLFELDLETGLGPQPPLLDGTGRPRGPMASLRFSDDLGHTWSDSFDRDCGQAGQYNQLVRWYRLGYSRGRIYELSVTDPVPWRIVDGYVTATPTMGVTERISDQYRKQG